MRRSENSNDGAVMVEASLAAVLLISAMMFLLLLSWICYQQVVVEYATVIGTRKGNASETGKEAAIITQISTLALKWGVRIDPGNIRICPIIDQGCTINSVGPDDAFYFTEVRVPRATVLSTLNVVLKGRALQRNL